MSGRVYTGNLPFGFTKNQPRWLPATQGEDASFSEVQDQSNDRYPGLASSDDLALVQVGPAVEESQPELAASPVWWNGTLPGAMAGKRPAPNCPV
jgi:hypothetical protein